VVPGLIDAGAFQWPWLGIEGADVNLFIGQANQVPAGKGAYIVNVVPGGPADQAGLHGGADVVNIDGVEVPTGGDIVIAANGEPIENYAELQAIIASQAPGSSLELTIVRNGAEQQVTATLGPRP
jgi:S1-C subfamily serine protease